MKYNIKDSLLEKCSNFGLFLKRNGLSFIIVLLSVGIFVISPYIFDIGRNFAKHKTFGSATLSVFLTFVVLAITYYVLKRVGIGGKNSNQQVTKELKLDKKYGSRCYINDENSKK